MNSYTANLAAAFTNHLLESNINSVSGLLEIPNIRFGCLNGATISVLEVAFYAKTIFKYPAHRVQQIQSLEELLKKSTAMASEHPQLMQH